MVIPKWKVSNDVRVLVFINVGNTITNVEYSTTTLPAIFTLVSAVGGCIAIAFLFIYTLLKPY